MRCCFELFAEELQEAGEVDAGDFADCERDGGWGNGFVGLLDQGAGVEAEGHDEGFEVVWLGLRQQGVDVLWGDVDVQIEGVEVFDPGGVVEAIDQQALSAGGAEAAACGSEFEGGDAHFRLDGAGGGVLAAFDAGEAAVDAVF